jgi:peptide chain release factor 1
MLEKLDKLEKLERRHQELELLLADPAVLKDRARYRGLMQEHAHTSEVVRELERYRKLTHELANTRELAKESEGEMAQLAREELHVLEERTAQVEQRLRTLLVPPDPLEARNIIMEIRAGTGGEEAALFAADLYRMYVRYAESRGWKVELMASHPTGIGGYKEIILSLAGKNVYESMRYESGVHRVQRVPATEAAGRIHTSAVTVSVLPEAEETEIEINPKDLRIDVFRSAGPGGQSVNTTDSAVRITHLPTGLVVSCQDEKSQHKNKGKALRVLKARLFEQEESRRRDERAREVRSQIGSGDRSERIRTYNFPQNRVTDHRVGLTLYKLEDVMLGDLEQIIQTLRLDARERALSVPRSPGRPARAPEEAPEGAPR